MKQFISLEGIGLSFAELSENFLSYIAIISPFLITHNTINNIPVNYPSRNLIYGRTLNINGTVFNNVLKFYYKEATSGIFTFNFPFFHFDIKRDLVSSRIMSLILDRTYNRHELNPNGSVRAVASEILSDDARTWLRAFAGHNRSNPNLSQDFRDACETNYVWIPYNRVIITPQFIQGLKT